MSKIKAYIWAHLLRTVRYKFSLVNWGVVDFLWMSIYMLAILAFSKPSQYGEVVPLVFWTIVAFSLMSTPVWTIGNWMNFYVNIGVFEVNEISNVNHLVFLLFRALPSLPVTAVSAAGASLLLYSSTGINPLRTENLLLCLFSLGMIFLIALFYSLIIAFSSLATSTPAPLLDFMNFFLFFAGGIAVPIRSLPKPLRIIALATPYSYPSEILRYAVSGLEPYLSLKTDLTITLLYTAFIILIASTIASITLKSVKKRGLKGIGRT